MPIRELDFRPEAYAHFAAEGRYRWLELHDNEGVYAHCAIAERDDALELHVSVCRWGPQTRRNLKPDFEWLKEEARMLGKKRIMGLRANDAGDFDSRFFRFARLYGFTDLCVFQTACMDV